MNIHRYLLAALLSLNVPLLLPAQEESQTQDNAKDSANHPDPKQLQFTNWTPDFEVPDPVAISIDEQGRAYVTQTQRRKAQDLDIRNNRDWIVNDVGFQSVEEKRAFYLDRLAPENSAENTARVADLNGDGSHDYLDLMQLSERIYLIQDTDGSGTADSMGIFAENFQTEVTGIAAGVLVHQGSVYATIAPDVWKMSDQDGDGSITTDEREIFATGFGLHIAYGGHDMHGLTVGPDGRIYWSIGDKGISVTSKEGEKFHYPNQGGVLRCYPDGSGFEVFAHGLRNVQELAFDDYGNLFGVDNDSDREGEMERFVYIVPGMDAGWRCNYQYREGDDFNPWTDEKLWHTHHEGQPAYIVPPIRHYVNGPAGFTRDPGTALGPDYRHYFFLTSAPNGQQYAFQVKPDGASFKMVNEHQIGDGIPLVGIDFGPDGALYGVDWGGGYPLNEKGAVWKIDVPGFADSEARRDTAEQLRADYGNLRFEQLAELLDHPDQRVRLKAQFKMAAIGNPNAPAHILFDGAQPELARVHALWTLGQMRAFTDRMNELADEPNSELRAQFARLAGDAGERGGMFTGSMIKLCADASPRVRFFAALALGKISDAKAVPALLTLADALRPEHGYLRHAVVTGLAGSASADDLAALHDGDSKNRRLCATLALRRQASPQVAAFLRDPDPLIATEAARAIHDDFSIPEALPALASTLNSENADALPEPFLRRALNAALRVGSADEAKRAAEFSARSKNLPMLLEALDILAQWTAPAAFDRVDGRVRQWDERDPSAIAAAITPSLSTWLRHPNSQVQAAGLRVAASLSIDVPAADLLAILSREKNPANLRIEALNSLHSQKASELPEAIDTGFAATSSEVRIRAARLLAETAADRARDRLAPIVTDEKAPLAERQAGLASLSVAATPAADAFLSDWMQLLLAKKIAAPLQLDLLTAAEARRSAAPELAAALDQWQAALPAGDLMAAYLVCLEGGDSDRGRAIATSHLAAQCTACHKIQKGKGSTVGPDLTVIGDKHPPEYLLESLVDPQKVIAPGFGMISLTLKNGDSVAGSLYKEKDDTLQLRDAEGKTTTIKTADVASRSPVVSTMPPMFALLNKTEIRDLVAFLKSRKAEK